MNMDGYLIMKEISMIKRANFPKRERIRPCEFKYE